MHPTTKHIAEFRKIVANYFAAHGRHDMPWRQPEEDGSFDPYKILVSEVMLQQTQVSRVIVKYHEFLQQFPTVQALAQAPLSDVLRIWQGLGYNRRAKFLWQAAGMVVDEYGGEFPHTSAGLTKLPGVGINTAGAILAYAFNQPVVFVETNIRTVFIHHFFKDRLGVTDKEIIALVDATLDRTQPRRWYWSLMDYGTFLKQTVGNLSRSSQSYKKQPPLKGSRRAIRGQILRLLAQRPYNVAELEAEIEDERLASVLDDLGRERLIQRTAHRFELYQ